MVRFQWHVEGGHTAHVPVNGVKLLKGGIAHVELDIEMPGTPGATPKALLTMPAAAHRPGTVKSIGVVLSHDLDAAGWRGELLTGLAEALAAEGYLVMRSHCVLKEARRLRAFEKALDAAATSPYAIQITSWVHAGVGNGARIAATVGMKCRGTLAGFLLLSYPLQDVPASVKPLAAARAPMLFVHTAHDPLCSVDALRACCAGIAHQECRVVLVPGVSAAFADASGSSAHAIRKVRVRVCVRASRHACGG